VSRLPFLLVYLQNYGVWTTLREILSEKSAMYATNARDLTTVDFIRHLEKLGIDVGSKTT